MANKPAPYLLHHGDYRGDYGLHNRTTTQATGKIVKKVEETNIERSVHHSFSDIRIILRYIMAYFAFRCTTQWSKRRRYVEWVLEQQQLSTFHTRWVY